MKSEEMDLDEEDSLANIEIQETKKIIVSMKQVYSVWNEIGINKEQKIERAKVAWKHIQNLVQDIYNEENTVLEELRKQVINSTKSIAELSRILSVEMNEICGVPLIIRAEALSQQLDDLNKLKEERSNKYEILRATEHHYCKLLDKKKLDLSSNAEVPSEADLKELEQYINKMKEEENKLRDKLLLSGKQLIEIYAETGLEPETELEKQILSGNSTEFSNATLKAVENAIHNVEKQKSILENKKQYLLEKLTALWDRLKIDDSFQVDFLSKHADCKAQTIKSIEQEFIRCEEMKFQNIKLFIESIRQELKELWDKCGVPDSEKLFQQYFSPEISEELLSDHEKEVNRLKAYYEEVKPIVERIEQRNKLWDLLKTLDDKSNDPNRFKNRGGTLLKEERERKKLQKTLPALEDEIYQAIEKYEAENNKKFYYFGEDYKTLIENQWKQRSNYKENTKNYNQLTPSICVKQRNIITPKSAPSMRKFGKVQCTPPTKQILKSCTVKKSQRNKTIKKYQKDILESVKNSAQSLFNDTSYTDFAKELDKSHRQIFRSSVVASKKIGGTRTKTPNKNKRKSVTKPLNVHNKN